MRRIFIGGLAALLCAAGCGGGGDDTPVDDGVSRVVETRGRIDALELVATSRSLYRRGETMLVTLKVTNTARTPFHYNFGNCTDSNTIVRTISGRQIAVFGSWGGCTAEVIGGRINPGETRTIKMEWRLGEPEDYQITYPQAQTPRLPAGMYIVEPMLDAYETDELGNALKPYAPRLPAPKYAPPSFTFTLAEP
ncbi:MAG: hypothetical protein H7Y38_09845 [Armatimonadetes bacterium]|nr:hypothetical protein [Armatimonadota bacterium]